MELSGRARQPPAGARSKRHGDDDERRVSASRRRNRRCGKSSTIRRCSKPASPAASQLDKTSDTGFQAVATIKIGPVKAKFKGRVTLSDIDPPNGYKISGQGEGGVAGFAKGGATVKLAPKDGGTLLTYDVEAQIGGKLAQLGQRLINGAAKKVADDFFGEFCQCGESEGRLTRLRPSDRGRRATCMANRSAELP